MIVTYHIVIDFTEIDIWVAFTVDCHRYEVEYLCAQES